jgi:hypothetical protein
MRRAAALILAAVVCLTAGPAYGSSWERIFARLSPTDTIRDGVQEQEAVYAAVMEWTITNNDGLSGNFEGTDTVDIRIEGTGLAFSGTKDGLIDYADAHASEIWQAIFGITPGSVVTGTSEGQFSSTAVVSNLVPPAVPSLMARRWTNDVLASGEYNFLEVGNTEVTGTSGIATYGRAIFGPRNQVGLAMPYRMLSAEDPLNTDIDAFQPTLYYKRDVYTGQPVFLTWGVAGFFGVNHVNSDLFEDGYYFRYGGNTFASVGREIFPWLAIFGDASYEIGKYWCPEGSVDEEIRFIAKALNGLPEDHIITYGARAGLVFIPDWLWGTVQVFRSNSLNTPEGVNQDVQTVVMGKLGTRILDFFYVDLGYKTTFEVKNYTDNTIIFNARAVW